MGKRYRFGALPADAEAALAPLYNETVARAMALPNPAGRAAGGPATTTLPVAEDAVLFTHALAATQHLARGVERAEVRIRGEGGQAAQTSVRGRARGC